MNTIFTVRVAKAQEIATNAPLTATKPAGSYREFPSLQAKGVDKCLLRR